MQKERTLFFSTATILWLFLSLFPWQGGFEGFAIPRFAVGVFIYLLPGALTFLLLSENRKLSLRTILGGLVVALFVTGLLGLTVRIFHLNFTFVRWAFALWGAVVIWVFYFRPAPITLEFDKPSVWEGVLLAAAAGAAFYFSSLARPPLIHDDAFTYNALLYYYQHAPAVDFSFPAALNNLKTPRFWLAFWPLAEALISAFSGVDGLFVTGLYLPPLLAVMSFVGVYVLARTLGIPRALAGAAILAQGFGLMRLTLSSQSGKLFFQRLTEDKVVAAFVISLTLVLLAVEYLEKPGARKLLLVWIAAWAMGFTHPVQLGMISMVIGVYCLLSMFKAERRVKYFLLIGVLASVVVVPYLFRFGGGENAQTLSFTLGEVEENDEFFRLRRNRVEIIEGTQFYGLSPYLTQGLPYRIGVLSALASLFFFWRDRAARYVLASFIVLGLAMLPYTGWLIGMFTTPYQLWRLTWLTPLGIASAVLIWLGVELIQRFKSPAAMRRWLYPLMQASAYFVLMIGIVYVRPWASGNLYTGNVNIPDFYNNYINAAKTMNQLDVEGVPIVVGGPDAVTHSIIPSLTMKYAPLVFRVESGGGNTMIWRSLTGEDVPPDVRLERLREYNVEYLLVKGDPEWIQALLDEYPSNISFLFKDQRLAFYKLSH
jgi:hypothetical protein